MKSNLSKINILYFIVLTLFVGVRILSTVGAFNAFEGVSGEIFSSVIIQIVLIAGVSIGLYMLLKKKNLKQSLNEIGFNKISGKAIWICIGIGIVVFLLNIFVSNFFNGIIEFFGYTAPTTSSSTDVAFNTFPLFLLEVFLVAVLPGICEEILHRGILLKNYNKELGTKRAIILSSLMFGLMHLNVQQFFYASILGVIMAVIDLIANSIWPSVIVHFMNNFLSVYLSYAALKDLPFGNFANYISSIVNNTGIVGAFIIIITLLLSLIFLLIYLILCLFKEIKLKKVNNVILNVQKTLFEGEQNGLILNENEYQEIGQQLENGLNLNAIFQQKPNLETFLPVGDFEQTKKMKLNENIFLYASIFLGSVVTLITFIWGVL